jgi:hypothetical protein
MGYEKGAGQWVGVNSYLVKKRLDPFLALSIPYRYPKCFKSVTVVQLEKG